MSAARFLLLAHLLGVTLFYGNLAAAWLLYARARQAGDTVRAELFAVVNLGDRWLTPISVALVVGTGVASARELGLPWLGTRWLFWSILTLAGSGLVFALRLLPLQRRLARPSAAAAPTDALLRRWARWAVLATVLATVPLGLMVLRPGPLR